LRYILLSEQMYFPAISPLLSDRVTYTYEEVRQKTNKKYKSKQSSSQSSVQKRHTQQSLPRIAAKKKKAKLHLAQENHKRNHWHDDS